MNPKRVAFALLGAAALAGCDIPTEAPIVEQRWILPVENTALSVAELLPTGVSVSGSNFDVEVGAFTTARSLGSLCAACQSLEGLPAPTPAFEGNFTVSQGLPADISAVTVVSGAVTITIRNGFSFDPIAGGGSITVTLSDGPGGRELGQTVFSGSLPGGQTTSRTLDVASGAIGASLLVTAVVKSPGGQTTVIDNSEELTIEATPGELLVGSATVNVANQAVSFDDVDLDVEDIDSSIIDRVEAGGIILDVSNPFGISLNAQVDIVHPGGSVKKSLTIGSGATSTVSVSYTGEEFKSFLGQPNVKLTGSGTVAASEGSITVTPGQQAEIKGKIDLTLKIGG